MIFWILLGLAIAAVVTVFVITCIDRYSDFGDALVLASMTTFIGVGVGGVLLLLLSIWFGPSYQPNGENDYKLVALQTSSGIEGRSYFLGGGYINGERTLNYITNDGGAVRVESADADDSVIYEDARTARVTVVEWDLVNPWFAPWSFGHAHTYEFHIPEGSILSDYTITND